MVDKLKGLWRMEHQMESDIEAGVILELYGLYAM